MSMSAVSSAPSAASAPAPQATAVARSTASTAPSAPGAASAAATTAAAGAASAPTSSPAAAPASAAPAAPARATDGDYKVRSAMTSKTKDSDGDYKPLAAANSASAQSSNAGPNVLIVSEERRLIRPRRGQAQAVCAPSGCDANESTPRLPRRRRNPLPKVDSDGAVAEPVQVSSVRFHPLLYVGNPIELLPQSGSEQRSMTCRRSTDADRATDAKVGLPASEQPSRQKRFPA